MVVDVATAANVQGKHSTVGRRKGKLGGRGKCVCLDFPIPTGSPVGMFEIFFHVKTTALARL